VRANGVDLAGYTLPQRVDDLDAARRALGYRQVDLLSESGGRARRSSTPCATRAASIGR
jgi:hypothetical protein